MDSERILLNSQLTGLLGKTATLISRIGRIYAHNKANPDIGGNKILVLAFSTSAAHEVRERLSTQCGLSGGDLGSIEIKTYHSFCYKVIRTYYKELNFTYPPMLCGNKICYKYLEVNTVSPFSSILNNLVSSEISRQEDL